MGRDILNAREAEFDLNSRVGWMKEGSVFMAGPHMYVSGKQVDKLFGDRYVFKNARVTLCDGDRPAWAVDADEAEVEMDGYATLRHTTLNILDVPVMDAPFMMLPAKTSRQSGLLFPDMGYSSLNGGFYSQPYFHVIDESRDLTFYATVPIHVSRTRHGLRWTCFTISTGLPASRTIASILETTR